jgi:hypothetical protein
MAEARANLSYAGMIRQQAAEDVARWHAQRATLVEAIGGRAGGPGPFAVWRLVGVYEDREQALAACGAPQVLEAGSRGGA